jgi:hypothetical protein
MMLTETRFVDVDAIVSKFKLTIASAKSVEAVDPVDVDAIASKLTIASAKSVAAVDPVDADAIASKFKLTIASAKFVAAVDPVDADAIVSTFKLTIASAKSVAAVDPDSTVLTVPAVTSTFVIASALATPMVSASAKTVTGSKCFILASTGSRRDIGSLKSTTRKAVRLAQRKVLPTPNAARPLFAVKKDLVGILVLRSISSQWPRRERIFPIQVREIDIQSFPMPGKRRTTTAPPARHAPYA